jgi:hypothetical protein
VYIEPNRTPDKADGLHKEQINGLAADKMCEPVLKMMKLA